MRRSALITLAFFVVVATLFGATRLTRGAQQATPAMDCAGATASPTGIQVQPLVYGATMAAIDHELWRYRVTFEPGAELPLLCYPEAMTVEVLEGSVTLTVAGDGGSAFYTPAGTSTEPKQMDEQGNVICPAAECDVPRDEAVVLEATAAVFHEAATYSYLAGDGGAVLIVSALVPHEPTNEPPGYSETTLSWLACCIKYPLM